MALRFSQLSHRKIKRNKKKDDLYSSHTLDRSIIRLIKWKDTFIKYFSTSSATYPLRLFSNFFSQN